MNDTSSQRNQQLQEQLREAMDLVALYHSKEFQQRLLPKLLKDSQQQWLDPLKFPNQEEFQRVYNLALAKAQVSIALVDFLSKQEDRVTNIRKQLDEPDKNYGI